MATSSHQDGLQRFIFDDTDIRGEIVSLGDSIEQLCEHKHYPAPIQALLGEFLAAASLLSSTLKFAGILTLQARGDGDLPLIMAEVSHQKKIRGIAQLNEGASLEKRSLSQWIGQGVLSITIDPDKGERYQGIVPLEGEHLSDCLEAYFQQSEQLPTRLWLASDNKKASGMLLQRLPQQVAEPEVNDEAWETLTHLAQTTTTQEMIELDHETLLTRLFHEVGARVFELEPIRFSCSCSKERSAKALKQLDKSELMEIIEQEGQITVDCHFCGYQYHYSREDIETLFAPQVRH